MALERCGKPTGAKSALEQSNQETAIIQEQVATLKSELDQAIAQNSQNVHEIQRLQGIFFHR